MNVKEKIQMFQDEFNGVLDVLGKITETIDELYVKRQAESARFYREENWIQ